MKRSFLFSTVTVSIKTAFFLLLFVVFPGGLTADVNSETDFSFLSGYLDKYGEVSLFYTQYVNQEKLEARVNISKSSYAGRPIFISSTESEASSVIVYIDLEGNPVRTRIIDKRKNIRYFITYGKKTILSIIKEGTRNDQVVENDVYDMSVLGLLLSARPIDAKKVFSVNLLDYKSGDINRVTISVLDENDRYSLGEEKIKAIRYKISTFILYETILYYGQHDFPVLLYYKGPTSINFFSETSLAIKPGSYKKALEKIK